MEKLNDDFEVVEEPEDNFDENQEDNYDEENDKIADLPEKFKADNSNYVLTNNLGKDKFSKFSPIDYSNIFPLKEIYEGTPIYSNNCSKEGATFFCIHGAGHSGASYSMFADQMKDHSKVVSFDFGCHGFSLNEFELSKENLLNEAFKILKHLFSNGNTFILMGHSMGGSIATFLAEKLNDSGNEELHSLCKGLVVIDSVEGTAMEFLPYMEDIVKSRPKSFESIEKAIEFSVRNNIVMNVESARVSIPTIFEKREDGKFYWKTLILPSKIFWHGWFEGQTKSFLNSKVIKLLVLANVERMDKDLTVAHMQGKFKSLVIPDVGHFVHEDNYKLFSKSMMDFVKTFRINEKLNFITYK